MTRRSRDSEPKPKITVKCDLCGTDFAFGDHIYRGKCSAPLKLSACESCYSVMDGFAPFAEKALEAHFKAHNLEPFPRDSEGKYIWPLI
jgi:hypothetical protein